MGAKLWSALALTPLSHSLDRSREWESGVKAKALQVLPPISMSKLNAIALTLPVLYRWWNLRPLAFPILCRWSVLSVFVAARTQALIYCVHKNSHVEYALIAIEARSSAASVGPTFFGQLSSRIRKIHGSSSIA